MIRPGAQRVHLYTFDNVLKPRGPMQKESLSLLVYERLQAVFASWTDPEYADSRDPEEVKRTACEAARSEVEVAITHFLANTNQEAQS